MRELVSVLAVAVKVSSVLASAASSCFSWLRADLSLSLMASLINRLKERLMMGPNCSLILAVMTPE